MRRVLQLRGLSGLLLAGLLSTQAFAQEAGEAEGGQANEEQPSAEQSAATAPAATAQPVADVAPAAIVPPTAVAAPVAKPKVGDLSISGYFRGGFGASNQKGRMTCFALAIPGSLVSKWRLGNECEVWAEMHFASTIYVGEDGTVGTLHFMPTAYVPTSYIGYSPTSTVISPAQDTTSTGATLSFPNLYVDLKGISWLFGGTAWAGNRYYKRESLYISDFFYWNPSGVGAGVEDIELGHDLRLSYGVFAVDGQPKSGSPTGAQLPMQFDLGIRNDIQLRGIRFYEGGEFQIGFQYIQNWTHQDIDSGNTNTHSGWGITLQHVQDVLGGTNKIALQYGKGGGTGFGTLSRFYYPDFSIYWGASESRMRVTDVLTIQPTDYLGAQVGVVFQRDSLGQEGSKQDWYSAGTRLSWSFTDHAKLLGEAGYDRVKKANGADPQWLAKLTIAPALAGAKGFWGRPEIRLFYTWAVWNEYARTATIDSGRIYTDTYKNLLSGSIFGIQAEAMW
jgi:maltoporin